MVKKKIAFIVFVLVFVLIGAEWIEIVENQGTELFSVNSSELSLSEIDFSLNGYELETLSSNGEEFYKISVWNEGEFLEIGKPDLPRFSRLFAIPDEGEVTCEIQSLEDIYIPDMKIFPRQSLRSESQPNDRSFHIDEDFYQSGNKFPQKIIEVGTPVIMRDIRLVNVTINPFQYDPQTNELRIITDLSVDLRTEGSGGDNVKTSNRKISRIFADFYRNTIMNYPAISSNRDEEYQNPSYLFIYPSNISGNANLQNLIDWKHQKGFEVTAVSTSETGSNSSSIKSYIQNAYDNWENPPEFLCLVGDAGGSYNIPTWFENWSGYNGEGDHPYTQLEGNDILADMIVGRLSFNSLIEFETIVYKIMNYEKEPYLDNTQWYEKTVLVGDPSSSGPSCIITKKNIKEMIDANYFDFSHQEAYSGSYVSQMSSGLNSGAGFFNYRGWYGMSGWDTTDIANLSNDHMLPFVVAITCDTGSFSGTSDCISEAFLKEGYPGSPKGGIGAIATATIGTHTCFNNSVDIGIYHGIFVDDIFNMGGALLRGKLNLYINYPNNPSNKVDIFSHFNSLMGDPGLEVWTSVPKPMYLDYDQEVSVGTNYLQVTIDNENSLPLENVRVTALQGDDDIFISDYTDENGEVFLNINAEISGEVTLTATKHNYIPQLESFDIISEDVFLNVAGYDIDDDNSGDSNGNDNGEINPGETIELNLNMQNFGTTASESFTVSISSDNELITISDNVEEYNAIDTGNSSYSLEDFDITIDPSFPGNTEIVLNLLIEEASNQWSDLVLLPVRGAALSPFGYSIIDGNNGILDPGESADLEVTLKNAGSVTAENIVAALSCEDDRISIIDGSGSYNNIAPDEEEANSSNRFEIQADSQILPGSQIMMEIHLTNDDGYDDHCSFLLEIGIVEETDPLGPDSYGYTCYDSYDIEYDLAPQYSWIEINPAYGGNGTNLNLYDNGETGDIVDVDLPFDIRFYGIIYDDLTVCSNGWVAPGGTENYSFMNWSIPGPGGPSPMIAPFWDDLEIGNGEVCYYYDETMHYFIVEWSHLQNSYNNAEETFQMILYDPDYYPSASGDVNILFQYETINNVDIGSYSGGYVYHGEYATVGLEDHTSFVGLEYTFSDKYPTAAAELENGLALFFTTTGSDVIEPPTISIDNESFHFALDQGESDTRTLQISNSGEANLVYYLSNDYLDSPTVSRDQGGPDNYGYQWIDSNEPGGPEYNWIDISDLGTYVPFTDNDENSDTYPLDFSFNYYGIDYNEFRINPNGWIGFGNDNDTWLNTAIPSVDAPRPAIFPFWDDLYPEIGTNGGGDVYYYSSEEMLVVWFDNVIHYPGTHNGTYDFQVILYQTGEILYQYRSVSGDTDTVTIGIQNESGTDGLQVVYNANYVGNNLAIKFEKIVDWLEVVPQNGFVATGETQQVTLTANSEELDYNDYHCDLYLISNDPENGEIVIPITITITSELPDIEVSEESFDFGEQLIGAPAMDSLVVSNNGNEQLNITDILSDNIDYYVDITEFSLQTGEEQVVQITFLPEAEGNSEGTLTIQSNDPDEPNLEIDLLGIGVPEVAVNDDVVPKTWIEQSFPNPFNRVTSISYSLSKKGKAKIEIFNIKGQKIKTLVNNEHKAGIYKITWNGRDDNNQRVASGIYYYLYEADDQKMIRKMVLLR